MLFFFFLPISRSDQIKYAIFHRCSYASSSRIKSRGRKLKVPAPNHYAKMRLFLHQKLHYHFSGVGNGCAGTEDGGDTGLVEEVIVLCGDDTTGGDHDIRSAEFFELLDDLRNEGLVTCRERRDTQYLDIVLLVGSGDP